jgi:hypothetical protein
MDTTDASRQPTSALAQAMPEENPCSMANIQRRKQLRVAERLPNGQLLPGSVLTRAGRPQGHSVQFLARRHTGNAIALLAAIVNDTTAQPAARCTAAVALLDRGWGKSPVQIDLSARTNFADFLRDLGLPTEGELDHPCEVEAID